MRLVVGLRVFEERDFIKSCIEGILPFVDQLIVIEGTWASDFVRYKHSLDGTNEILDSYKNSNLKVLHYSSSNQIEQNEFMYKEALKYDPTWFLIHDADEFYLESDLIKMRTYLDKLDEYRQRVDMLSIPCRLYWNDFYHYEIGGAHRFFRVTEGSFLKTIARPSYKNGNLYNFLEMSFPTMFHMSYVRDLERFKKKLAIRKIQNAQFQHYIYDDCIARGNIDFDRWVKEDIKRGKLEDLPRVLQNHPFANKVWNMSNYPSLKTWACSTKNLGASQAH